MSFFRFSEIELDFPPFFAAVFCRRFIGGKRQQQCCAVWIKALHDFRLLPALFLPDGTDARQTAARALTDIDQVEHLNERLVSRVGYATAKGLLHIDTERAGIGDANFIRPFLNHQTAPVIVVGVNQGVCQSLAQSLMQRGVINAVSTIQFERNFYVLRNAVINAEIKVTESPELDTILSVQRSSSVALRSCS